jgi:hypothetical protein
VGFAGDPAHIFVVGGVEHPAARHPAGAKDFRSYAVLNKFGPSGHGEAQVQYLDGDFRVISPGTYVRCAITDERIPLDELKYWSVDLQEAYAVPTAVLKRHFPGALKTPE